ncbi:MAG: rod shape-determining protein RodA [Veillonellaceae bacterium]|nr:rod shape-determining protein RodA [Veillonellaceae bacterium]
MIDRRMFRNIDFWMILATVALVGIGILMIGSATHINSPSDDRYWYVQRQGLFALMNFILILVMLKFDYRILDSLGNVLYGINLLMLVAVMFVGQSALGAQRWIQLGPITLQPSEFAKLIMIISLAHLLDAREDRMKSVWDLLPVAAFVVVPFLLVLKQPDLGTSLVFLAILLGMVFVAGIDGKLLLKIMGAGAACLPVFWLFLKDYQKSRLTVFLDPNVDPLGAGYHIIQSKIAIGSGQLFGKGLFNGTQSQLNFLPENHTDFIFAVIGEELGFVGAVAILLLYMLLLYRGVQTAKHARDKFGTLLAAGITSMMAFHVLVNVGMTIGIMPVTGIPLPFMSYGVSALTTNLVSIGILLNIQSRRQKLMF